MTGTERARAMRPHDLWRTSHSGRRGRPWCGRTRPLRGWNMARHMRKMPVLPWTDLMYSSSEKPPNLLMARERPAMERMRPMTWKTMW
eukprot:5655980-Pleurochrysis_carterae.AAC.1